MHHHRRPARAAFIIGAIVLGLWNDRSFAAEVSFAESFADTGTVEEAGSMSESASPDWWVNSGGRLIKAGGIGGTIQGDLPTSDRWAQLYASSNPLDTDGGIHPQNIFRLVTRRTWTTFQQTAWFRIRRTVMSSSPNRNASNGILFFHRYLDGDNLYYAGVRVDGAAVVKKKRAGVYTTLGYTKIYPGTWNATSSPNLLPIDRWIGLRTVTRTEANGSVRLTLEVADAVLAAGWKPVLDVVDSGASGAMITSAGHAGIRTDFMDVEMDDYDAVPWGGAPTPAATMAPTPLPTPTPAPPPTSTPIAAPTSTPALPPATPTWTQTPERSPTPTPTRRKPPGRTR